MDLAMAEKILDDSFRFTTADTHRVIRFLNLPKNSKILDVGTGVGNLAITLAVNGYRVITGEPEDDDSAYAKRDWLGNARKVGLDHRIEFKPFDAKAIPFADGTFDAIFSLGTLHHVEENDRAAVLAAFARAIRANGIICFFEPNPTAMEIIRERDGSHPDAANPDDYVQDLDLTSQIVTGVHFDAFLYRKA